MASNNGFIPPLILPVQLSGNDYTSVEGEHLSVEAESDGSLSVNIEAGHTQSLADGVEVGLEMLFAINTGLVSFRPAGSTSLPANLVLDTERALNADSLILELFPATVLFKSLLSPGIPVPAIWIFEGIDTSKLKNKQIKPWAKGEVENVIAELDRCYEQTFPDSDPSAVSDNTKIDNYVDQFMAGDWSQLVRVETQLGVIKELQGAHQLRIRAIADDGTELDVAPILAAFGQFDPDALANHPLVTRSVEAARNSPVRIYLQFMFWDVDVTTGSDPKGELTVLPTDVKIIIKDQNTLVEFDGAIPQEQIEGPAPDSPVTYIELDSSFRNTVAGKTFYFKIEVTEDQKIHLERDSIQYWHGYWSTIGWLAIDRETPGSFDNFTGTQLGMPSTPLQYMVGTRVNLAMAYEQQMGGGAKETRRFPKGIPVKLYQSGLEFLPNSFSTDDNGEVSGISFGIAAGSRIGVSAMLLLKDYDLGISNIIVRDDPNQSDHILNGEIEYYSDQGSLPIYHENFNSHFLNDYVLVDCKKNGYGGNTPFAAGFFLLKHARYTHEWFWLLNDAPNDMPEHHEIWLRHKDDDGDDAAAWASITEDNNGRYTHNVFAEKQWFSQATAAHEYAHSICWTLAGAIKTPETYSAVTSSYDAAASQFMDEFNENKHWHVGDAISNEGVALVEGLAGIVEFFMSLEIMKFASTSNPVAVDEEKKDWAKYIKDVYIPTGNGPDNLNRRPLHEVPGRMIEHVFASAISNFLYEMDGYKYASSILYDVGTETTFENRSPINALGKALNNLSTNDRDHLKKTIKWLLYRPIMGVLYGPQVDWSGQYNGVKYPTVTDYLNFVAISAPSGGYPYTYADLEQNTLRRWNLEKEDSDDHGVGPSWPYSD